MDVNDKGVPGARLIFLGPPGAGKGTQAELLADWMDVPHISTGEILRGAIAAGTALGKQAKEYVESGELVPDDLLAGLVRDRLAQPDAKRGWILDGYPRTDNQARYLDQLLGELGQHLDGVINLDVPDATLTERLLGRGRQDDTAETVARRLQVYREQTAHLIDFYRERPEFHSVDGDRPPEAVETALKSLVRSG